MQSLTDVDWEQWRVDDPATLVFVIQGRRVLLIRKKRGLGAGKINGPGGKQDPGETLVECARRECEEELKISPQDLSFCGDHRFQFTDGYAIHVHVFRATRFTGTPTETDEAIPLWFDVDEIPYDQMWEDDAIWLPLVFKERPFSGRWIFDADKMLDYELMVEGKRVSQPAPAVPEC